MLHVGPVPLWKLVRRVVAREVAQQHAVIVGIVVAFGAFMARSWPPHEVRAALLGAAPAWRAGIAVALLAVYLYVAHPSVRTLLASRRLAYLRHLPLSPWAWAFTQTLFLLALGVPMIAAVAYLVAPLEAAWACCVAVAGGLFGAQVLVVAMTHRPLAVRLLAWAAGAGFGSGIVASGRDGVYGAAALGLAAFVAGIFRLRHRFPEPRVALRRRPRLRLRTPTLALARLELLALARRDGLALFSVMAVQLLAMAALGLARANTAPDQAGGLLVGAALAGAYAILRAARAVDRDRWYLDSEPVAPRSVVAARMLVGLVVSAPTLLFGAGLVETLWACSAVTWLTARAEAGRRLHAMVKSILAAATVGVVSWMMLGRWALVALATVQLWRAYEATRRAAAARRRFETSDREDDHG